MAYTTGNAVGSTDVLDLSDNTVNFDKFSIGDEPSYPDRFGRPRKSISGMEADYSALLLATGFESNHLIYGAGIIVQRATQLVERSGVYYRVTLQSDLPLTLSGVWATDALKLTDVGDLSIRLELAAPSGAGKIGIDGAAYPAGTLGSWASQTKFPEQFATLQDWAACGGSLGIKGGVYPITSGLVFPYGTTLRTFGEVTLDASAAVTLGNFPKLAVVQIGDGTHTLLPKSSSNYGKGNNAVTFVAPHGLVVGDVVCIYNPTDFSYASWRAEYRAGEFCRVIAVTSTTRVIFATSLYASYVTANVDVYKINGGRFDLNGALKVLCPDSLPTVRGVHAYRLFDSDLSKLWAYGLQTVGAITLNQCFNLTALGVTASQSIESGLNNDYGLIISNCQHLELEGYFVSARHGLSTGGYTGVGAVTNRDINVRGTVSTTGEGGAPAIGLHGNTEHFTFDGRIYGGYGACGNHNKISGEIYAGATGVAIMHTELTGYSHDYSDCRVFSEFDPTGVFRGVIDCGGNNEAAAPDTIGGLMDFSGVVVSAPLATSIFRITNRNSPATTIRVDLSNAKVLSGAAGYESVRVNHVTGSLPGAAGVAISRADMTGFDAPGEAAQVHAETVTTGISIGGYADITLSTSSPTATATVTLPAGLFKDVPIPTAISNTNFVGSAKPSVSVTPSITSLLISVASPNGANFSAANVVRVFWTARTAK